MYRPTVRYNDVFKTFVDSIFHSTYLDRNQILRAALFAAAHSAEFKNLVAGYQKKDVTLPSPGWNIGDDHYWREQGTNTKRKERDVNVIDGGTGEASEATRHSIEQSARGSSKGSGSFEQAARSAREVPSERFAIRNQGGITITIN